MPRPPEQVIKRDHLHIKLNNSESHLGEILTGHEETNERTRREMKKKNSKNSIRNTEPEVENDKLHLLTLL